MAEMEPVKPVIPVIPIRKSHMKWTQERLSEQLEQWRRSLQEQDRSAGTVEKYVEAVLRFLAWYEQEEGGGAPLQLEALTPIALIGYRSYLQHEQQKSVSTINLRISALRAWCGWLVDRGHLTSDPSSRVKLVSTNKDGGGASGHNSKREGLTGSQVNALLRQAQASGEGERNYAILQVLLQTGIRLSECSGLRFGDITFGERSGMLLARAGKGNKARSVPLNSSAREALAVYVAPRLGWRGVGEEKTMSLKVLLKVVAAKWPRPGTSQAFEPVWLSRKVSILPALAASILQEPVRIKGRDNQSYVVLTLCRMMYTLHHGTVASKAVSARWAQETLDRRWGPLIERALAERHNPGAATPAEDVEGTLEFILYALERSQALSPASHLMLS